MEIKEGDIYWYEQPENGYLDNMFCLVITAEPNDKSVFALEIFLDFKIRHLIKGVLFRNIPGFGKNCIVSYKCIHHLNREFFGNKITELSSEQFKLVSKIIKDKLLPIAIHDLDLFLEEHPEKWR